MASNVGNEWEAKENSKGGDDACHGEAKKTGEKDVGKPPQSAGSPIFRCASR